jgi:hypothetical protein
MRRMQVIGLVSADPGRILVCERRIWTADDRCGGQRDESGGAGTARLHGRRDGVTMDRACPASRLGVTSSKDDASDLESERLWLACRSSLGGPVERGRGLRQQRLLHHESRGVRRLRAGRGHFCHPALQRGHEHPERDGARRERGGVSGRSPPVERCAGPVRGSLRACDRRGSVLPIGVGARDRTLPARMRGELARRCTHVEADVEGRTANSSLGTRQGAREERIDVEIAVDVLPCREGVSEGLH